MRLSLGRNCLSLLTVAVVLLVYIAFRENYFFAFPPPPSASPVDLRKKEEDQSTPAKTVPASATAVVGVIDEAERVRKIVDSLPQVVVPGSLKYGFELLKPERATDAVVPSMTPADAETAFYKYIGTLQIRCPQKTRIGRAEDGGWDACITGPFNISQPCLVYSIGMGGEWSFDHMITDTYKCPDMAYDPTLGKGDHKPKELLWFFNTGLGIENMVNANKWRMRTFGKLLEENKHTNSSIDILKIDIEYSEWESLEAILKEGSLRNVKQLMVEFHTMEVHEGKHSSSGNYSYYWQILRGLDKLGFKTWHYLPTPTGQYTSAHTGKKMPCCANVYFVNTTLLI